MQTERQFYVYAHHRKSDGRPFYIGKGCGNRLGARAMRSKQWKAVVDEYGYKARKVTGLMPAACALSYERAIISSLGIENLANIASGGAGWGLTGYKWDPKVVRAKARKCYKPVINSNGQVFPSMKDAVQAMRSEGHEKAVPAHISACCNNKRHVAYGYSWSFDTSKTPPLKDASWFVNEKRRRKVRASNGMVFESVTEAAAWVERTLEVKCGTTDISGCCKGKRKTRAGLSWSYA